jgi:hypothetical protein
VIGAADHRQHGRDNRHRREHRRPARGPGHDHRPLRSGTLLDRLPAVPDRSGPARGEAGGRRRSQGAARGRRQGAARHAPALPRALAEKPARPCPAEPTSDDSRHAAHDLRSRHAGGSP